MAKVVAGAGRSRRNLVGVGLVILLAAAAGGEAIAQQPKGQQKPAPAAKAAPAQAAAQPPQSAWVKLCDKVPVMRRGADGKEIKEEKGLCVTQTERIDGNTGMVLVSAAIRQVEGMDKQHLMVLVPLGMQLPPGLRAAVYSKDLWAKAQKNEKIDEKQLAPFNLKFQVCDPRGCMAEYEATKELFESMRTGGGMVVLALNLAGQPVPFPVPLDGFEMAYKGPPVDNQAYDKARTELYQKIRERQLELMKLHQQQQQDGAGGAATAPAAPAPSPQPTAKKK